MTPITQSPESFTLDSPEVKRFFEGIAQRASVIFVTGCARSGTSLLQRCISTVADPEYLWSENSLWSLLKRGEPKGRQIVLKRTSACHKTHHLIPPTVKVVHIVRHPAMVLTSRVRQSSGYYVTPQRWRNETRAFWRMAELRTSDTLTVVRYEDLVDDPDLVQAQIANDLGVDFDLPFSRYCERNSLDCKIDKFTNKLRVWEKIDSERNVRHDGEQVLRLDKVKDELEPEISKFCDQFSYNL